MEYRIIEVTDGGEKSRHARAILGSLPEWFGQPASLEEYVEAVPRYPFWAAMEEGRCLGFVELITETELWDKDNPCLFMIKRLS